jgi:CRISPR-associated protein Csb2
MIGLDITFLTGRFHGTPWHHAHNEGVPEWPPSPWRVLRALVSAAYSERLSREAVEPLLEKLRGLPRYHVPEAVDAHTRHWMPDTDDALHKRGKVFDAFVAVAGGARTPAPLRMTWDTSLTTGERALLERLAMRVSYLGRGESWTEISVVDPREERFNCWPDEVSAGPATTLTALMPPAESEGVATGDDGTPVHGPMALWDVLTLSGERFRREGWTGIPGARLVRYRFRQEPFRRAVAPRPARGTVVQPTVAVFAVASTALPKLQNALLVGERVRQRVMSESSRVSGNATPTFSGHGVTGNHGHARYLLVALDASNAARGLADHVVVIAEDGFDDDEVLTLQRIRQVWVPGRTTLPLVLTGIGTMKDFGGIGSGTLPIVANARVWESVTPFVPTRHPKMVRGRLAESIPDQISRACELLRGQRPSSIEPFGTPALWTRFHRRRRLGGGRRGVDMAVGARIVFPVPVSGPIALGYGAHFGLGLFKAIE